jgi:predicted acylesterase/phospholipase RssA
VSVADAAPPTASPAPRRALMLAGGGVKVAYQAGVLQVWLDEAGLEFDLADGASGGVFNLAMWCQGMSGTRIADNWRRLEPLRGVDLHAGEYLKLFYAESLFELDAYRENVFPGWGLDLPALRGSTRTATFNAYNFSRHRLAVRTPAEMTEDFLVACVSLPMWFPPVTIDGDTHIDAVFVTDCNLEEAIRRGADELWVIWTVSDRGDWQDGFVANYFQIIEAAAVGHYRGVLDRIEASNRALERGDPGEFGRPLRVREIKAEVPLHYLINFGRDRFAAAVELGVRDARAWCRREGISLRQAAPTVPEPAVLAAPGAADPGAGEEPTRLRFSETMRGTLVRGVADPEEARGREGGDPLVLRLDVLVDDVDRFVTQPQHRARLEGWVECAALGGKRPVASGTFDLLVHDDDPRRKRMLYRLHLHDGDGEPLTLAGEKRVEDDPGFDLWEDTTTLFVRLLRGHVEEAAGEVLAAGVLRLPFADFLRQLTTFRTEGGSVARRAAGLARFGNMFLGKLWDVYATKVLSTGPL